MRHVNSIMRYLDLIISVTTFVLLCVYSTSLNSHAYVFWGLGWALGRIMFESIFDIWRER